MPPRPHRADLSGATRALAALLLGACVSLAHASGWTVVLEDGKRVSILGEGASDPSIQTLERRLPDGSPDLQFGRGGRVQFSLGAESPGPRGLAADVRGRILITGAALGAANRPVPATLRFLPDGRLDTSWGEHGRALSPAPQGSGFASEVLALGDGSVLLLGQMEDNTADHVALWLLKDDGSTDTRFGQAGLMPATGLTGAQGLSLQRDTDGAALIAMQIVAEGAAWLEVHRWQPGSPQPVRVARQELPGHWQGPIHLSRQGGNWQWFDASLPAGQGGMPLVAVSASAQWVKGGVVVEPVVEAAATSTTAAPGHAAFNPFEANAAKAPPDALDALVDDLAWPALALGLLLAGVAFAWWQRRD